MAESRKHGDGGAVLFSGDGTPDPGNRYLPGYRSVLLLALFRKRSNVTQDALGVLFDVDQSTVCRYLQFADSVLNRFNGAVTFLLRCAGTSSLQIPYWQRFC